MNRSGSALLLVLFLLPLAACDDILGSDDQNDAALTLDEPTYQQGGIAQATLRNTGDRRLSYAPCYPPLERFTSEGWQPEEPPSFACPAVLLVLDPGEELPRYRELDKDIQTGTYRLTTRISVDDDSWTVRTAPFTVTAP